MLALYAPFGGNTPTEYLFKDAGLRHRYAVAVRCPRATTRRRSDQNIDLVVNLISDADQSEAVLPLAADLVDRPACRHQPSAKMQQTTRDAVAELLRDSGLPHSEVLRLPAAASRGGRARGGVAVLLPAFGAARRHPWRRRFREDRRCGRARGVPGAAGRHRPLSDRIYRLSLGRRPFPEVSVHLRRRRGLALSSRIGHDWKLHHVYTDMAHQPWMQQEEAAFLDNPGAVFGLAQIRRCMRSASASVLTISASIAGSTAKAISSCSRSMPRCWCMLATRASSTRTPMSAPSRLAFDAMLHERAGKAF